MRPTLCFFVAAFMGLLSVGPADPQSNDDSNLLGDWRGESVAVLESLDLHKYKIERFPFGSFISFAEIG